MPPARGEARSTRRSPPGLPQIPALQTALQTASVIPSPPTPPESPPWAHAAGLTRLPGGRQLETARATSAPARRKPTQPRPRPVPARPLPAASGTRCPTGCGHPYPTPPSWPYPQPSFPGLPYLTLDTSPGSQLFLIFPRVDCARILGVLKIFVKASWRTCPEPLVLMTGIMFGRESAF